MKILMPVLHYHPVIGGLETWTQNIAERLADRAEIFIVTGKVKNQLKKEELNGVKILRTSLLFLSNLSNSPKTYIVSSPPFIFFKALALIRNEKIDILHCQGFLSSLLGFCLSVLTGIPYITTVQRIESKRNKLKNFIYKKASFCIGASSAIKKNFEDIGVKNIEVIPNGVDLSRFKGLARRTHDEFTVITVARLEKVKGIEYLIRAVDNFRLLIIGDGSERKNLEYLVEELGLKEKIKFLGQIANEKIPAYLMEADCFCLPSLREGFGIAILEAQAAGIPVIATRTGGILDLIKDGETGFLVDPKNTKQIKEAVFKIQSDQELAQNLTRNAKEKLVNYNWSNIADRVYKVYEKLT
ncbi:MAG: glycosyltransferase family 4 protein [Candidatus Nealsonbacteria bacterium]